MDTIQKNIFFTLLSFIFLIHWSKESSIAHYRKPAVNFEGIIALPSVEKDQTSTQLDVENITIEGRYKGILLYAKQPKNSELFDGNPPVITLKDNPRAGLKFRIDLNEIKTIEVPHRRERWVYKRNKKSPIEYIEISITSKGPQGTTKNYLVEVSRKIKADEKDPGGPIQVESTFAGIKRIIITSYHEQKDKDINKKKNGVKKKSKQKKESKKEEITVEEVAVSVDAPLKEKEEENK